MDKSVIDPILAKAAIRESVLSDQDVTFLVYDVHDQRQEIEQLRAELTAAQAEIEWLREVISAYVAWTQGDGDEEQGNTLWDKLAVISHERAA